MENRGMQLCRALALLAVLLLVLPAMASDQSQNFSPLERPLPISKTPVLRDPGTALSGPTNRDTYWQGTLRVYVVEHESSLGWNSGGHPYEFPFLAYAINSNMITLDQPSWDTTVTWDGFDYDYNNLQENNIAVQAVLFSASNGLPEAAAMADPGVPGSNVEDGGSTHTVFVEEGTATW